MVGNALISIDPKTKNLIRVTSVWHVVLAAAALFFGIGAAVGSILPDLQGVLKMSINCDLCFSLSCQHMGCL